MPHYAWDVGTSGRVVCRWPPDACKLNAGNEVAGRWAGESRPSPSGHPIWEGEYFP